MHLIWPPDRRKRVRDLQILGYPNIVYHYDHGIFKIVRNYRMKALCPWSFRVLALAKIHTPFRKER